jgi:hypothetical protein
MKIDKILLAAVIVAVGGAGYAQAGALRPGVSTAQTTVAVQSRSNAAAYFALPALPSVIRQTFTGAGALRQNAGNGPSIFG